MLAPGEMSPAPAHNSENQNRLWAGILSRMYMPVLVLWLYALAVGHGWSAQLLAHPLLTDTLAPSSYYLYLFQQPVGQWYWRLTRGEWWSYWRYRKSFYWFSPKPCPVAWWEYFFIVILATWLSMLLTKVEPTMQLWWSKFWNRVVCNELVGEDKPSLEVVCDTIEELTGMTTLPEHRLDELGLASIGVSVLAATLATKCPEEISLAVQDLVSVQTVQELIDLLDERRKNSKRGGV